MSQPAYAPGHKLAGGECQSYVQPVETLIGRRNCSRWPIDLAARFVAVGANVRVQLEDISRTGAMVRLMHPRILREGRLRWLDRECFAQVVWQREERCGLRFEDPLDAATLRRTLEFGEEAARGQSSAMRRLASAWVHGPGDY